MPCPLFMTCPHEKEAYLWVCDDMPTCAGFGTFDGGISLKQISSSQIFSGIRVSYSNNQSLFSYVDYFCDYSLKKGEIKLLDSTLVLSANGKIFHFQALSRDACPLGDVLPTPQPFYPSIPEPGHTSTPSPIPSPNGKFFTYNETHYIEFDLKNFDQSTHSSLHILTWKDNVRDLDVYMSLWDGTKCPPGYMCNEFQDDVANVWGCWIDADLKAICFPIGNLSEDIRIEELGKGIMVSYNGLYGTKTEFRYQCDENLGDYNYVLENGVGYHSGLSGVEYSFDARSGGICQKAFIAPEFPHFTPSPSPVVMGDPIIQKTLYSEDKVIDFDLSEMNVQNIQAILRNTDGYENVLISFSPNKRTDCIAGYNCGDFDDANVWLCWEEKRCFPVGDARYGYTIELVDDSDLGRGVNLTVNGGLGGYMTTVIFSCNMSAKSVSFEQFGEIDQRVILYASSTNACVTDRVENFKIGSMFLLVILTLITVYLSFGTFIGYCARKDIFMPNENFWNEFSLCVKEALSFIFSCRRSHDEYVNI
ncbi:hypothetical protein GPJ56_005711 [Histomonas meleagridis]|uniref:uncharacterized protein n=1 Tax=Histomonas meleagridis TaxID=135588 RepID=UPI00355940FC|nr:hypothetical protein GPJ56_005711 [Histomonas meleagridis]KAH0803353.1 hypothetical protein GO595_003697 [Histomonas meleagridis]